MKKYAFALFLLMVASMATFAQTPVQGQGWQVCPDVPETYSITLPVGATQGAGWQVSGGTISSSSNNGQVYTVTIIWSRTRTNGEISFGLSIPQPSGPPTPAPSQVLRPEIRSIGNLTPVIPPLLVF